MKQYIRNRNSTIRTGCFIVMLSILAACGGDNEPEADPTPAKVMTGKTLDVQSVKVNGVDKTSLYSGLTLTMADGSYRSTNGDPFFQPVGTWRVTSSPAAIEFDGSLQSQVTIVSENLIWITFTWEDTIFLEGRSKSVEATYVLEMQVK